MTHSPPDLTIDTSIARENEEASPYDLSEPLSPTSSIRAIHHKSVLFSGAFSLDAAMMEFCASPKASTHDAPDEQDGEDSDSNESPSTESAAARIAQEYRDSTIPADRPRAWTHSLGTPYLYRDIRSVYPSYTFDGASSSRASLATIGSFGSRRSLDSLHVRFDDNVTVFKKRRFDTLRRKVGKMMQSKAEKKAEKAEKIEKERKAALRARNMYSKSVVDLRLPPGM